GEPDEARGHPVRQSEDRQRAARGECRGVGLRHTFGCLPFRDAAARPDRTKPAPVCVRSRPASAPCQRGHPVQRLIQPRRVRCNQQKGNMKMKAVLLSSLMGITTLLPISAAVAADCYSGGGGALESMVRKEEAVRLTTELNSKVMNALDKVLLSTDASRVNPPDITTNFGRNIKFVLDLQLDQENMDLLIERPPAITTAQKFIDTWFGLTTFFKYRK